jgi:hypothetical protein
MSDIEVTVQDQVAAFEVIVAAKGASAYEIAVANGFVGIEEQWLDSLAARQLAVAFKSDTLWSTQSTSYVDVPGLAISVTIPDGPYVVEFQATGFLDATNTNRNGSLIIADAADTQVSVAEIIQGPASGTTATEQGVSIRQAMPHAFHTPAPESVVTYKVRGKVSNAGARMNVIAGGWFGPFHAPFIRAEKT